MQVFKVHLMLQNFGKSLSPNHFEIGSYYIKMCLNKIMILSIDGALEV
jgi:hypothetical protein